MTRRCYLVLLLAGIPLTLAAFGVALGLTGFLACGISGCGGGGFGPSFSPVQAQSGVLVTGLTLVPLALLVLHRQPRVCRLAGGAAAVILGATAALTLLDLGVDGCPQGQSRAIVAEGSFSAGAQTCSADRDAVPSRGTGRS